MTSTTLSGTITVHGTEPARAAVVELRNATGDIVDQVQVDDDGRYVFHLVAGRWSLNVWDGHGHRGKAEVQLDQGQADELCDIDLQEPEGGH